MSKIEISQAEVVDAEELKSISINAFIGNLEKYGHYPPGIESLEWHQDKIENGIYYTILYSGKIIGGVYLIRQNKNEMEIEYLFINPEYQDKKVGANALNLLEKNHTEVKKWVLCTLYKDFRNHQIYQQTTLFIRRGTYKC